MIVLVYIECCLHGTAPVHAVNTVMLHVWMYSRTLPPDVGSSSGTLTLLPAGCWSFVQVDGDEITCQAGVVPTANIQAASNPGSSDVHRQAVSRAYRQGKLDKIVMAMTES